MQPNDGDREVGVVGRRREPIRRGHDSVFVEFNEPTMKEEDCQWQDAQ